MKKILNVLLCFSSLLMINSFVINKKTDFNETPTLLNNKGIDIKKVHFGDNEEVETSKIYTQWATLNDESTSLRFAIALKGNIETITFIRNEVIGLEITKEANIVNVDTVYKSIAANNKNYYYTSEGLSLEDNDSYYWACYTINYSKDSSLKQNNIELSVKINDLDPITTKASLVGTQYLDNNEGHEHTFVKKYNTNKMFDECSECGTIDNIEDYIPVESITLTNFYQEKIVLGSKDSGTKKLNVSVSPSNATFVNDIKYEIKDEKVATLSQNNDGTTSIAKKGIGKTELEISCGGVIKSIPVEVIELNDNNLIKDSSELEIKKAAEITTPGWYTFFDDTSFKNTLTMSEGVITGTSTKQATASKKPQLFQIRYLPADTEGNPYIGEYYLGFKVTNNTDTKLNIKYNINGDNLSDTYSLDKGKGVLRVRLHLSLAKVEDVYDFFSLKISKVGKGTFTINEIYFIPVTNN